MNEDSNIVDFDIPEDGAPAKSAPAKSAPSKHEKRRTDEDDPTLPHSIEAEEGLLACCLLDGENKVAADAADTGIVEESFFRQAHRIIYRFIAESARKDTPADEILLAEHLRQTGEYDTVGGYAALSGILNRVETTTHSRYYARIVRDRWIARKAIRKQREINEKLFAGADPSEALAELNKFTAEMQAVSAKNNNAKIQPIMNFRVIPDDDDSVLLGTGRWICRGSISALVSTSGMGKSSIVIQKAICYALGRPFMGIRPNGCLRSLIIQSEDDAGDVGEIVQSVVFAMELTDDERAQVNERVMIATDKVSRGEDFINALMGHARRFEPDIVWINPLHAFFEGDISSADDVGRFLREGLARANRDERWAYVLVHHTTKPSKEQKREIKWNEAMYEMAGSAEIINTVRVVMILQPTDTEGEFFMNLAKRGKRAGVLTEYVAENGSSTGMHYRITTRIPMCHSTRKFTPPGHDKPIPMIFWEPREPGPEDAPAQKTGRKRASIAEADMDKIMPASQAKAQSIPQLYRLFREIDLTGASEATFRRRLGEMRDEGKVRTTSDGKVYRPES